MELSSLLHRHVLLRRTKDVVLKLPLKQRSLLRVVDPVAIFEPSLPFHEKYSRSWKQKWQGIIKALRFCLTKYSQVVCFAHHRELLDKVEHFLSSQQASYVRIDGSVDPDARKELIDKFSSKEAKIAVISITACAVGVSFAGAQCALFCELPPDSTWMAQAEDRLHRPGQLLDVHIFYVVGIFSPFDESHFRSLCACYKSSRELIQSDDIPTDVVTGVSQCCDDSKSQREVNTGLKRFLFAVSKNTQLIHVRLQGDNSFHSCLTFEEAHSCIRQQQSDFWMLLHEFLTFFGSLSSFQRRLARYGFFEVNGERVDQSWKWFSLSSLWTDAKPTPSGAHARYRTNKPGLWTRQQKSDWGCWYSVKRMRSVLPAYYFGRLHLHVSDKNSSFSAMCCGCSKRLINIDDGELFPGAIIERKNDSTLFCCGPCRELYFALKSSGSLRYAVRRADGGVCSRCHVDCEQLRVALSSVISSSPSEVLQRRYTIIQDAHPLMLEFPVLLEKAIANPLAGNLWHADHIIPVSQGGGESSLSNVQTLCVVCHQIKTKEDMKKLHSEKKLQQALNAPPLRRSTVDVAADVVLGIVNALSGKVMPSRLRVTCA